jgi:hypothetical protein
VVEAGLAPAVIMLNGRELFILQPGSSASLEANSGQTTLRLLNGTMDYVLPETSRAQVYAGAHVMSKPSGHVSLTEEGTPSYVPPRARAPITTNTPSGLRPRSPNSPCATDKTASPPRSPCSQGRGPG